MRYWISFTTEEYDFRPKIFPVNRQILGWWNVRSSFDENMIGVLINSNSKEDALSVVHNTWTFRKKILCALEKPYNFVPSGSKFILDDWMQERLLCNNLKDTTTYLIGPMDRVSREDAVQWRTKLTKDLRRMNVGVMDPCNKPFPEQEDESFKEKINSLKSQEQFEEVAHLMKTWAVRPDLRMVDKADFLVCKIDLESHMCGSYWEMCIASSQRKPILIVCEQGKKNVPNWLFGLIDHHEMFSSFPDLINYLQNINDGAETTEKWKFLDMEMIYA